jgi:hypothetical protein
LKTFSRRLNAQIKKTSYAWLKVFVNRRNDEQQTFYPCRPVMRIFNDISVLAAWFRSPAKTCWILFGCRKAQRLILPA